MDIKMAQRVLLAHRQLQGRATDTAINHSQIVLAIKIKTNAATYKCLKSLFVD